MNEQMWRSLAAGLGLPVGVGILVLILRHVFRSSELGLVISELARQMRSGDLKRATMEKKSLHGMDNIYGPRIAKNFPGLNLDQMKGLSQNLLKQTLTALSGGEPGPLKEADRMYREELEREIAANAETDRRVSYRDVRIDRVVVSDYRVEAGLHRITFQLSFTAIYAVYDGSGALIDGDEDEAYGRRASLSMIYIQDLKRLEGKYQSAFAAVCPHCGAPLEGLGAQHCLYCGSPVEPVHLRVWKFNDYNIQ